MTGDAFRGVLEKKREKKMLPRPLSFPEMTFRRSASFRPTPSTDAHSIEPIASSHVLFLLFLGHFAHLHSCV